MKLNLVLISLSLGSVISCFLYETRPWIALFVLPIIFIKEFKATEPRGERE